MAKKKYQGGHCKIELDTHINEDENTDYPDIDYIPIFSEHKKFSELDKYDKTLLRDYIHSQIAEYREETGKNPSENELIEIKKRLITTFDDEYHILLNNKNDKLFRKFFADNVTATIAKLQKATEEKP